MLENLVKDLESVANFLDGMDKKARLINIGDDVVCLNPVEGICKGQRYRVTSLREPNYIEVEDLQGNTIGCFRQDRFCHNNKEY